ncbi:MAG TPA: beta-ketoacyl synthase N-terminal-like domain-containing protein [Candidatus Binatia bacterium]|nr:beta-ketoacyl synthase N-terminal-like domain-containing protein [Candidatus Binatia bacterium]
MNAPIVRALGWRSGWGPGLGALPEDARRAAAGRPVVSLGRPALDEERFRRATRDCLWAVAAVGAMLEDAGARREAIAGARTALIYVTAAAYGPSNRAFIERPGAVYFPYTAPAAAPAEVAIEYGLTGPLTIFIGGGVSTLRAIWHAAGLLAGATCDRVLVLAVEIFDECADLYARVRSGEDPLVEAAGCAWLERGTGTLALEEGVATAGRDDVRRRVGETFSCEPLAALGLRRSVVAGAGPIAVSARWGGEEVTLIWGGPTSGVGAGMREGSE